MDVSISFGRCGRWYSQEGSDTEFHEAVQKLSIVVGNYIKE
jgi:hypothetical protein